MKLFRTSNGFIFDGEAKIGDTFVHESCNRLEEIDRVICVGDSLKDLIQIGDIVERESEHADKHSQWLMKIDDVETLEYVKKSSHPVKRIYHSLNGIRFIESPIMPYEYTKQTFWYLGEIVRKEKKEVTE